MFKRAIKFTTRDITEIAILIALSIVLNIPGLKFQIGSNGGSISLSMVPLFVICLRKGLFKGFISCGIIYGFITCLLDGWGLQTFPFDYLLGYGSICVICLFKRKILQTSEEKINFSMIIFLIIAVIVATALRLLFSTISGMLFFEFNFVSSVSYNALYVLPSGGIVLAALLFLLKPLLRLEKNHPSSDLV